MADFRIRVVVDPANAVRGTAVVRRELDTTAAAATRLRSTLAATFGAAALGAGIRASIGLLADFDQEMSTVRAVSGATGAQFAALREEAQRLGTTTRFTAVQAAQGMVELSRAGFTAAESLTATQDVLRLAQAGALGLGEAAGITANVVRGFQLNVDQATRVTDVLAKGANSAKTTVSQLGQALSFVAPVSKGLNISLEQTTAAILALSNAGLESSRAGTGLRRVLTELESPSEKTRDILRQFGITNAKDVQPSVVGLEGALRRLNEAQITTGKSLEIFGDRGGAPAEVLRSLVDDVSGFERSLIAAGGTAQTTADIMDDNLNGALLSLTSAIQGVVLEFGELGATSFLTRTVRALAAGFRFLADNLDTVLAGVRALAIGMSVQLAQVAIPAVITGLKVLGGQLTRVAALALANPFTALATGAALAIGAIIEFGDRITVSADGLVTLKDVAVGTFEFIRDSIQPAIDAIRREFGQAVAFAQSLLGSLGTGVSFGDLVSGVQRAAEIIARVWNGVRIAVLVVLNDISLGIAPVVAQISTGFGAALNTAQSLFDRFGGTVLSVIQGTLDVLATLGNTVVTVFQVSLGLAGSLISALFDRLVSFFDGFTSGAGDIGTVFGDLLGALKAFVNTALGLFTGLFRAASVIFRKLGDVIGAVLSPEFFRGIGKVLGTVLSGIASALTTILGIVRSGLESIGAAVDSLNDKLPDTVVPTIEVPTDDIKAFGTEISDAFQSGFNQDFIGNVSTSIGGAIDEIGKRARERAANRAAEAAAAEAAANAAASEAVAPTVPGITTAPETGGGGPTDFTKANDELERQAAILETLIQRGEAAAEVARIQAEEGLNLTDAEKMLLEQRILQNAQLETQAQILDEIQGPQRELEMRQQALITLFNEERISVDEYSEAMRGVAEAIGLTASQAQLLESLRGPQEDLNQRQRDLGVLLAQNKITQEEFDQAILKTAQSSAELSGGISGGLSAAIFQLGNRANEVGSQIQNTLVGAFDKSLDAAIEFASGGKASFGDLASSIVKDLAKIALQAAITNAIAGAFGGGGGGGGGLFGSLFSGGGGGGATLPGGQQQGGQFTVGGSGGADSQLVAFPASPGEEVTVRRPDQRQSQMEPVVVPPPAVNVVTVKDPNEIPEGIRSKNGVEAMVAVISDNPDSFKAAMGIDQS